MPQYEFVCASCRKQFSKILTLADYKQHAIRCPHCGSDKTEQDWTALRKRIWQECLNTNCGSLCLGSIHSIQLGGLGCRLESVLLNSSFKRHSACLAGSFSDSFRRKFRI